MIFDFIYYKDPLFLRSEIKYKVTYLPIDNQDKKNKKGTYYYGDFFFSNKFSLAT